MKKNYNIWNDIELAAEQLGISAEALRKWKTRGVPHRWHIPIIEKTLGKVTHSQLLKTRKEMTKL